MWRWPFSVSWLSRTDSWHDGWHVKHYPTLRTRAWLGPERWASASSSWRELDAKPFQEPTFNFFVTCPLSQCYHANIVKRGLSRRSCSKLTPLTIILHHSRPTAWHMSATKLLVNLNVELVTVNVVSSAAKTWRTICGITRTSNPLLKNLVYHLILMSIPDEQDDRQWTLLFKIWQMNRQVPFSSS